MKNGVECYKDFFPYFKALKTNCERTQVQMAVKANFLFPALGKKQSKSFFLSITSELNGGQF